MAFHLYDINELFSTADGAVQFIELAVGSFNGESFWQGQSISVTQGSTAHRFTFSTDLPSSQTANTKVLIATQGFADLGIVTPDFIVPAGFLFTSGGASVNFAGVDIVPYTALPTDGTLSIDRNGATAINSPTNFAGSTGTVPIAVIGGTEGADDLVGTGRADTLMGGAGNDTLNGGGGNDTLDGGAGMDTAAYSGARAAYAIGGSGSAIAGPEGNDSLAGIERLRFSDRGVAFDLGQNQSAGNTVRVIGAAFDAPAIGQHPDWVGIGLQLFDGGMSMRQVCDLVAQGMNLNNTAFVTQVYTNVVGVAPDAASLAAFVGLLQGNGGAMTQGQLLELAATIDLNATININLAGLHGSGVEFV